MNLGSITSVITSIVLVLGAGVYIWGSLKSKGDQIDDETIKRLNNAIDALKLENESLRRENDLLRQNLATMQAQINQSKADIMRLTDLATNQTAIGELKTIVEKMYTDTLHDHKEIRDMIRQLPHRKNIE